MFRLLQSSLKKKTLKLNNKIFLLLFLSFLLGCAEQLSDLHFRRGEKFWRKGNAPAAIKELRLALNYNPSDRLREQVLLLMATVASGSMQDFKTSLWAHEERLRLISNPDQQLVVQKQIAEIYANDLRDFSQSINKYQRLLATHPQNSYEPEIRFEIARNYIRMENLQQANVELSELINLFPKSTWAIQARYQQGNIAYLNGSYKEARKIFQGIVNKYPGAEVAQYAIFGIGNCFEEEDDLLKAIESYKTIRKTYPNRGILEERISNLERRYRERGR